MAVPTTTLDVAAPARLGNTPMGVISGTVNVSSYDTAHPEVTAITGKFIAGGALRVCPNGLSSGGYMIQWDDTSKSFKAYRAAGTVAAGTVTSTGTISSASISMTSAGTVTNPVGVSGAGLVLQGGTANVTSGITGSVASTGTVGAQSFTVGSPTEATASANVGTFDFIAVGRIGG